MQIQPLGEVQQYGFDEEFYTLNFSMEREREKWKFMHISVRQQHILDSSKLYGINTSMATKKLYGNNK